MMINVNNQNISIVIADDDATTRFVLRLLLTENQFNVAGEAGNGEKAVDLCKALKPGLVFLDIDMPKMDGMQAAQQIRKMNPDIGIVMISAISTLDNVRQALQAGADAFVVKPFTAAKLVDAIGKSLKSSKK